MAGVARLSRTLLPTLKERPAEAMARSHQLLVRAGLFRGVGSGLHAALPLGLRSLRKVQRAVERAMDGAGGQQVELPVLLPRQLWQATGRWETAGEELFRLADRRGHDFCLAPTHEEVMTSVVAADLSSHRDLPLRVYQIGRKFRDELRPRYGLVRAREFLMKDLYSFDADEEGARQTYAEVTAAYEALFAGLGVPAVRVSADSGMMGGSHSEEFHVPCELGEDHLVSCSACGYAANAEVLPEGDDAAAADAGACPACGDAGSLRRTKGIEVAHAFLLGTRYSEALGARFQDKTGRPRPAEMGCFGVGVSRVLAAAVEHSSDDLGIRWPLACAPYRVLVVPAGGTKPDEVLRVAAMLEDECPAELRGEVLADDRKGVNFGVRMSDATLVGFPWTVVVGRGWAADGTLELQPHGRGEGKLVLPRAEALAVLAGAPPPPAAAK